ncbi:MAG: T9SS C-terminal target domain-containing protein [Bacteroidetes bacterium]|nr:MAG: T9SS C-terminal target domain-containing protein [Bacteroidota bacterium]
MKTLLYSLCLLLPAGVLNAQETITIKDEDLQGGQTYTWTKDNVYQLDGFVYLEEGGVLNIEAGTLIKGKEVPSTTDLASTLIIARGAKIYAEGTPEEPIVFTSELYDPNDNFLTVNDRGLWGGVIILGKARIADEVSEVAVEGLPVDDPRALFGGTDDNDDSGVLRYVSIRHGGAELEPGEEINGLTLGAVGSGTVIEHVEVLANDDDGIEFFGGTVNVRFAAVAFCGDDAFDWDTGYRGKGQFWFALQGDDAADNGGELDGAKPDDNEPHSEPTIFNATFIGAGLNAAADIKNTHALLMRDGTGGHFANSIFTDFNKWALQVEDRATGLDSYMRLQNGMISFKNNLWWNFGEGSMLTNCDNDNSILVATEDAEDPSCQALVNHLADNGNELADPQLRGISRAENGGLDPRPTPDGPATQNLAAYPNDGFFYEVPYKGAFDPNNSCIWIQNWTALDEYGVLAPSFSCLTATAEVSSDGFILAQNSPNPVRGETAIEFTLPRAAVVSLEVFDLNGRPIARLLSNETLGAGVHHVRFDTAPLPAGLYRFSLLTEDVVLTRAMVVYK